MRDALTVWTWLVVIFAAWCLTLWLGGMVLR